MKLHKQFDPFLESDTEVPSPFDVDARIARTQQDLQVKTNFEVTDTEESSLAGQKIGLTSIVSGAASTTIAQRNDFSILIEDLAVTRNILLPPAKKAGRGKLFKVKDLIGGAGSTTITITAKEGETIDGGASTIINSDYGSVDLFCNGTNWFVLNRIGVQRAGGVFSQADAGGDETTTTTTLTTGFRPALIRAYSVMEEANNEMSISYSVWQNGAYTGHVTSVANGSSADIEATSNYIVFHQQLGGTDIWHGTVNNVTATSFDIDMLQKVASPQTAYVVWEAEG